MATMLHSHLERVQPAGRQVAHEADRAKLAGAHHAVRLQLAKPQPQLAKPGPRTAITVPQLGWRRSRRQHGRWRLLQRRCRGAVPRWPSIQSALRAALGSWSEVELGRPRSVIENLKWLKRIQGYDMAPWQIVRAQKLNVIGSPEC